MVQQKKEFEVKKKYGEGFLIRLIARLLDIMYGSGLGFVVGILIGILAVFNVVSVDRIVGEGNTSQGYLGVSLVSIVLSMIGAFIYTLICEWLFGATLGKVIMGLRVLMVDGRPCTLRAAFVRGMLYNFDGLFCGLIAYSSMSKSRLNQRYGDKVAGTIVVKSRQVPLDSKKSVFIYVIPFVLGSVIWGSLLLLGFFIRL